MLVYVQNMVDCFFCCTPYILCITFILILIRFDIPVIQSNIICPIICHRFCGTWISKKCGCKYMFVLITKAILQCNVIFSKKKIEKNVLLATIIYFWFGSLKSLFNWTTTLWRIRLMIISLKRGWSNQFCQSFSSTVIGISLNNVMLCHQQWESLPIIFRLKK